MASLIRLNRLLGARSGVSTALVRSITTTPKATDASAAPAVPAAASSASPPAAANKNWVSYGFDFRDEANDRSAMKTSFFFSVTLCLVWGTFIWAYLPDPQLRDWAQREGYLALRVREQAGQEPISPHFLDPKKIKLPAESALKDVEIII